MAASTLPGARPTSRTEPAENPVSDPLPFPLPEPALVVEALTIFVRGAKIEAEVGVYAHEYGRSQPLVLDVSLELTPHPVEHIAETVNYERVVEMAKALAASGHFKLIETFAERLAYSLLDDPMVARVRVRVEKPEALAPAAEAAGVEVTLARR
jgi:dihydroneopterin aldolase